ncbi:hypothetical protein CRG98_022711 [Punica granatum]|uniref:Uncharacterized protein n=1 Tax=Punica granatum TaxID=22663 RepID=A0A2I0JKT7_PUNGR|nr:hypothetical protein CRG98_022711 [Punica granatum]
MAKIWPRQVQIRPRRVETSPEILIEAPLAEVNGSGGQKLELGKFTKMVGGHGKTALRPQSDAKQMSLFVPRSDGSHDVDVEEKEAKEILRNDPTARGAHLGRARLPASTINGRRGAAGP